MFHVELSAGSTQPPYEQLRMAVIVQVRAGTLTAGTKIPTVRALAAQLGIAPNTVARAYRELEADGVLETRGRQGSFIASTGDPTRDIAARAASAYLVTTRHLGIDDETAVELVRAAL
ncbi:GntR family transcriptional regulator [Nocardia camponoti]|uniref:GntR family transcriptional regulator n=1 Tax=Nocardia camponoti TaxID=1616106 RepID=A0A917QG82_9NOCA|nr:GntR family transcriptional regulator [Nocardia camponoti]GGK49071.1 GntR family transcriptional regulator [Nocardia camponoti]